MWWGCSGIRQEFLAAVGNIKLKGNFCRIPLHKMSAGLGGFNKRSVCLVPPACHALVIEIYKTIRRNGLTGLSHQALIIGNVVQRQ